MALDINLVMDALGEALKVIDGGYPGYTAGYPGTPLRVYDYPADQVSVPAAIVALPEVVQYDETYARGSDHAIFPIHVLVSKVSDRASRDAVTAYMVFVKQAIDGNLDGVVADAQVTEAKPMMLLLGGVEYLSITFTVEVIA